MNCTTKISSEYIYCLASFFTGVCCLSCTSESGGSDSQSANISCSDLLRSEGALKLKGAAQFGPEGSDSISGLASSPAQGVVFSGSFEGSITFGEQSYDSRACGVDDEAGCTDEQGFIAKTDADLDAEWLYDLEGGAPSDLRMAPDGSIFAIRNADTAPRLLKLSPTGEVLFEQPLSEQDDIQLFVADLEVSETEVVLVGSYAPLCRQSEDINDLTFDFGNSLAVADCLNHPVLMRVDPETGEPVSAERVGDGYGFLRDFIFQEEGAVVLGNFFDGTELGDLVIELDISDGNLSIPAAAVIVGLDEASSIRWAKRVQVMGEEEAPDRLSSLHSATLQKGKNGKYFYVLGKVMQGISIEGRIIEGQKAYAYKIGGGGEVEDEASFPLVDSIFEPETGPRVNVVDSRVAPVDAECEGLLLLGRTTDVANENANPIASTFLASVFTDGGEPSVRNLVEGRAFDPVRGYLVEGTGLYVSGSLNSFGSSLQSDPGPASFGGNAFESAGGSDAFVSRFAF